MQRTENPRVGGSSPSSATKNCNEIDEIYQSHLIYGEVRRRFNMLIFQGMCDQCVTDDTDIFLTYWFNSVAQG